MRCAPTWSDSSTLNHLPLKNLKQEFEGISGARFGSSSAFVRSTLHTTPFYHTGLLELIFLIRAKIPIPPMYLEQKRAEAQAMYREEQAYIASSKENFKRLMEEDRQAMGREMSGNTFGVIQTMFTGKKPEPTESTTAAGSNAATPEKLT